MEETVRYNYRLRPGKQAESFLLAEWNRSRWLWNEAVHQFRSGRKPTLCKLSKLLTEARGRYTWLREGSQNSQQQALRAYMRALDDSCKVKGRGRPVPKKRKTSLPSLEYTRNGFSIRDQRLVLPKGFTVPAVWHRGLPSEPTSVRVYQDCLGHWYASFVVVRKTEPGPGTSGRVGIDWGVSRPATATDPSLDLPYSGHRKRCAAEVARQQRKMARRARRRGRKLHGPQSNGYKAAARQAARVLKKAARQQRHDARQWANSVVAVNDLLGVEDFKPKFLMKGTMARKASDISIGMTKRLLVEVAERAGRKVVLVEPAYTTMTCSECFARAKRLKLDERTFLCPECGFTADRDRNAARTILAVAESGHTSVEAVRHLRPRLMMHAELEESPRL